MDIETAADFQDTVFWIGTRFIAAINELKTRIVEWPSDDDPAEYLQRFYACFISEVCHLESKTGKGVLVLKLPWIPPWMREACHLARGPWPSMGTHRVDRDIKTLVGLEWILDRPIFERAVGYDGERPLHLDAWWELDEPVRDFQNFSCKALKDDFFLKIGRTWNPELFAVTVPQYVAILTKRCRIKLAECLGQTDELRISRMKQLLDGQSLRLALKEGGEFAGLDR